VLLYLIRAFAALFRFDCFCVRIAIFQIALLSHRFHTAFATLLLCFYIAFAFAFLSHRIRIAFALHSHCIRIAFALHSHLHRFLVTFALHCIASHHTPSLLHRYRVSVAFACALISQCCAFALLSHSFRNAITLLSHRFRFRFRFRFRIASLSRYIRIAFASHSHRIALHSHCIRIAFALHSPSHLHRFLVTFASHRIASHHIPSLLHRYRVSVAFACALISQCCAFISQCCAFALLSHRFRFRFRFRRIAFTLHSHRVAPHSIAFASLSRQRCVCVRISIAMLRIRSALKSQSLQYPHAIRIIAYYVMCACRVIGSILISISALTCVASTSLGITSRLYFSRVSS
jgi:hypothetical protein